jgi:hypothetical protein
MPLHCSSIDNHSAIHCTCSRLQLNLGIYALILQSIEGAYDFNSKVKRVTVMIDPYSLRTPQLWAILLLFAFGILTCNRVWAGRSQRLKVMFYFFTRLDMCIFLSKHQTNSDGRGEGQHNPSLPSRMFPRRRSLSSQKTTFIALMHWRIWI